MPSVIIPAHNEEGVIERCLGLALEDADPGEFEVVVACNGCTDRTAELARRFADVTVLELSEASKSAALNAADRRASRFPRIYLDADVRIDTQSLRATATALGDGGTVAATPRLVVDASGASRPVRAFYAIWTRLFALRGERLGSGLFALSEAGRGRFSEFPSLVADDLFVRELFAPAERTLVPGARFTITTPARLRTLVDVRTRVLTGNRQLAAHLPDLAVDASASRRAGILTLVRREPRLLGPALVYTAVQLVATLRARARLRFGDAGHWDRDAASRATAAG